MGKNTEDYVWALQRAYNLLRADFPIGALAKLPAGGNECEALVQKAVDAIRKVLEPDDVPAPKTATAASFAGPRGEMVPVEGIRLRKEGECTVVDAEIGGTWIEVIRERSDGEFCHIVETSGMFKAYYAVPNGVG